MEFDEKLNLLLTEKGLRPVDVVKYTGATKASVSQWTLGTTRPGNKYLTKLIQLLNCDQEWLLDDSQGWEDRDSKEKEFNRILDRLVDIAENEPDSERAKLVLEGIKRLSSL